MLQLHIYPDPCLSKKCENVNVFDDSLMKFVSQMFDLMYKANGVGLAAPQVGANKNIIVIDTVVPDSGKKAQRKIFINPKIINKSEELCIINEGCLSLPNVREDISRFKGIELQYCNEKGKIKTEKFKGLLARILQHEIDHLNGLTMLNHLSKLKQDMAKKKIEKFIKSLED